MIFLIDEIFRGTNSKDRYIGAKNVLLNLNKSWIIGALTTHDLELCALDKDKRIKIIISQNTIRIMKYILTIK